ncbi:MAG: GAF domain-containing protein [Deltaproteobacteria bacterium]|nr:GAF domain-containing protein [Deltaproteobacteria bacterium]
MNIYSIPPFLTLCCFLGLAGLTIARGRRTKTNFLFFVICLLGAFLYIDILFAFNVKTAETALLISRIDHFFIVYLFPVYIHFFHTYLNISERKGLIGASYGYAFILMCFTPSALYITNMQKHYFGYFAKGGTLYPFFGFAGLFVTIYVLMQIHYTIRNETSNAKKNRLKYLFAGFGIMGLLNGLNIFPIYGYSIYPPGNLSFIPLIIFAFGLFKHDLLDMGILIKKSLIYSLLMAFLTCLYALIIIVANNAFKDVNFSDSIYFPLFFFLFIAFVFGPLKSKIQIWVDRIFLMDTIANSMHVYYSALFLQNTSGFSFEKFASHENQRDAEHTISMTKTSPLVKLMETNHQPIIKKNIKKQMSSVRTQDILSDMDGLNAEIALPMVFKENLNGFIVIGEKRSGDFFSQEDLDLLETLSSQTALAIENARSYKMINDLNKSLEYKVEERTLALKEALFEKERTQEQLIRSESLAAIGQLVAGVAHELNNPLTTVTSSIQTVLEDIEHGDRNIPLDEDLIDDLKFADKELGRARSIVTSLLGLSRQTQTYSEAVNINSVIKDALRIMHNQYKYHDLDIVESYATDLPEIHGNFANLGQVALNIIQNAIQAVIDIRGTIFLTTRLDNDTGEIVFTCKDTGPGVPEAFRQDIYKPFFTTKDVGKGTGLGLYICHEIILRHSGTLALIDTDVTGAEFEVRLPVRAEFKETTA